MSYYRRYDIALLLLLEWVDDGKTVKRTMRFPHVRLLPESPEFYAFAEAIGPLVDATTIHYAAWQEDHVMS